jgi:dTDP-4-dehydrorhamnose reductase
LPLRSLLVVGGDSKIGSAVALELLKSGRNVITTTRRRNTKSSNQLYLDLSKPLNEWVPPQVDACLLAGAVSSLSQCRNKKEYSNKVNVEGTLKVAQKMREQGSYVLFLSSNQVYNGSVAHPTSALPTNPKTLYGEQKAKVEKELLSAGTPAGILRLSKVLNTNNILFNSWSKKLLKGENISCFADYTMSPVPIHFVVKAILFLFENKKSGITQISGSHDISYYEAAVLLADILHVSHSKVRKTLAKNVLEYLPKHTTLDSSELENSIGLAPNSISTLREIFKFIKHTNRQAAA